MVQANRKSRKDTDVITLKLTRRQLRMIRNAFGEKKNKIHIAQVRVGVVVRVVA
jgi:hypothetical protein